MNLESILGKLKQYPVASGALALLVLLAMVAYFRMDVVPIRSKLESDLTAQATQMERNVAQAVGLRDHLERLRSAHSIVQERLVERDQKGNNQQYIYSLEQEARVRITAMAQGDVITDSRQRAGKPTPKEYVGVPFTVTVQGTFGTVMDFLYRLETGRRFARIDTFTLTTVQNASPDTVSLVLQFELLGKK